MEQIEQMVLFYVDTLGKIRSLYNEAESEYGLTHDGQVADYWATRSDTLIEVLEILEGKDEGS
jgi:hypothetical protein